MGHPHLLSPGRIGTLSLRNRILMCPMGDDQASHGGYVTPAQIAYYEARARGGAALLLVGSVGITAPDGLASPEQSAIGSDEHVEGWARLASAVQAHGAKLALQLVHNGKAAVEDIIAGRPLMVPSLPDAPPSADPLMGMLTPDEAGRMGTPAQVSGAPPTYHEMTRQDIADMAERYADAVERAKRAGVDACELHAGHGYLIDNFLSPTTNHRTDEYGGSVENRARFLVDVLHAIRRRVGHDYPVWCRINGEEFFVEGERIEDACRVAELAEAAGSDAFHVS
ncbi:MAG: NADH:flavin oxidoreductase, partial [Myxococcota bacterium]